MRNNNYEIQWPSSVDCKEYKTISRRSRPLWIRKSLSPKENLHIFGRFFFPNIIKGADEVPECHLNLIRELSNDKDSAIIFPRGFSKSTWEKIDTLHDIVYNLERVILYIANTISDAQNHFESIKQQFENNEALIEVYGNLVPNNYQLSSKWTNRHFETTNGVNVVARGAGKGRGVNIKNNRPTKIIFDDVEDDEEVASAERREKLHNWIYNVIFPSRSNEKSKIKFIGTIISPLCELLVFYKKFGGIFRKAEENGVSIWPAQFPMEKLAQLKDQMGTLAYMQELMNTPTDPSISMLRMEWLEPHFYSTLKAADDLNIIIMFDPQIGETKGADFYGLCVIGKYPKDKHRYVLELQTGKATQLEQAALLVRTIQRYGRRVTCAGIEKLMTQVAVYQNILEWQSGNIDLNGVDNHNRNVAIIPVLPEKSPGGVLIKKTARLAMHQPAFQRGEIHLHDTMRSFAEELIAFPNVEHDDGIDALIYCLEYANRSTPSNFWQDVEANPIAPPIFAGIRTKIF